MCACVRITRLTVRPRSLTAAANGSHCERTINVSTIVRPSSSAITPAFHTVDHGEVGGAWVEPLLGERVARLTVLHVPAKRYLVATDADYAAELSDGSALSLEFQGGVMTPDEAATFAADPYGPDAATLRR